MVARESDIYEAQWWGQNEPYFGDHNAVVGPDGYIYSFGSISSNGTALFLARVPQASGADLAAYQYWDGTKFSSSRLYNPSISAAVLVNGQGSIIYSPFYQKYLYFAPGEFVPALLDQLILLTT